ncbi:MAG: FAD-dependent thymidylate synthase [Planctomycetes bacterium]|nr:FAD-dependent thymidylate synthase [Planctomycetota bacterium]
MPTAVPLLSREPVVRLVNAFPRPYENAVATARTCYSARGIVATEEVSGTPDLPEDKRAARVAMRDRIAKSIYQAGHHTTLQHAHFQFALDGVSRQFLWSFLHAHPFYNSEQVSQRYVEVKAGNFAVPSLSGEALAVYEAAAQRQMDDYHELIELLTPVVEREYFRVFPARRPRAEKWKGAVQKKAQEIARYVLPLATHAYLYHTVSGLTLLRYWRLCEAYDAPKEQRLVVGRMKDALLAHDPLFAQILEEPIPLAETPEHVFYAAATGGERSLGSVRDRFVAEFDASMGGRVSTLVDWKARNEECVAAAVREVLGVPRSLLPDDAAIALVMDPSSNPMLGQSLNVTTLSKVSRALTHASYTFRKRLSHAADSQDQRHRMTPASRPCLPAYLSDAPDFVRPAILFEDDDALRAYDRSMQRTWEALGRLRALGVSDEDRAYLLPNAVTIRFTESADLLHLHHKLKMRLCYNAQEEIWRASRDEAMQIAEVNRRIGRFLLPPCALRAMAEEAPICPEGDRYCGVRVWKLAVEDYRRVL